MYTAHVEACLRCNVQFYYLQCQIIFSKHTRISICTHACVRIYMYIIFHYPFIFDRHLGWCQVLAIVNTVAGKHKLAIISMARKGSKRWRGGMAYRQKDTWALRGHKANCFSSFNSLMAVSVLCSRKVYKNVISSQCKCKEKLHSFRMAIQPV